MTSQNSQTLSTELMEDPRPAPLVQMSMIELFIGYEEFVMTYYDILDLCNTTTDPLQTIVIQETMYDPDAYICISREIGFF
jgi:hypothetical protein